jgi:hypothetical protein
MAVDWQVLLHGLTAPAHPWKLPPRDQATLWAAGLAREPIEEVFEPCLHVISGQPVRYGVRVAS